MDCGAAALYAARQCHQPDPAVDLAAQRRVKERTIQGTSHFLIDNMGLFFIPSVVGTLEYLDVLKLQLVPFLVVSLVSTPLVYAATVWSVRLLMKLFHAKEASHD